MRDGVLSEEIAGLVLAEDPALPGARQQGEDLVLLMPAGELDETDPQGMGRSAAQIEASVSFLAHSGRTRRPPWRCSLWRETRSVDSHQQGGEDHANNPHVPLM
jgi:hypothetical protein